MLDKVNMQIRCYLGTIAQFAKILQCTKHVGVEGNECSLSVNRKSDYACTAVNLNMQNVLLQCQACCTLEYRPRSNRDG